MTARSGFDALAPHYCWLEWLAFGPLLNRCRTAWLDELPVGRTLVVGDGDGRFAEALLIRHPTADVTSLDVSPGMARLASRRLARFGDRVRPRVADVRTADLGGPYDLIVTNFFLDCFDAADLPAVVNRLAAVAAPSAAWLVGDFARPEGVLKRPLADAALAAMYGFFRLTTGLQTRRLVDPAPALAAAGFGIRHVRTWLGGFLVSRMYVRPA